MLSPLAQRVLAHIRTRELMRAGDRVAIAVSGGADSVALLRLMLEVRSELGVVLSVVHFNHKIRGAEGEEDERFVRELAAELGLGFHRAGADVPAYGREHKISLETAARELRYEFLRALIADGQVNKLATAHTLDDQAETVLMRIIRGTGISGLVGIHPSIPVHDCHGITAGAIVRPLLEVRRSELERYLGSIDRGWRDDATNADLHHTRNRIRQLVMPLLEHEFNPAVRERLAELADIARAEEEFWRKHLNDVLSVSRMYCVVPDETDPWTFYPPSRSGNPQQLSAAERRATAPAPETVTAELPNVAINVSRLSERSVAEQRRILRRATQHSILRFTHADLERVLQLVHADGGGEIELAHGYRAWRTRDELHLGVKLQRGIDANGNYELTIPIAGTSEVSLVDTMLTVSSRTGRGLGGGIDITRIPAPLLMLRPWRAGDRFWPQHSSGPKKIKELLTDRHITGAERKLWPVIACGEDIVWLRGFGVSQAYVADDTARNAIVVVEQPLEPH